MKAGVWHWLTLTKPGHKVIGILGGSAISILLMLAISWLLLPLWAGNPEIVGDSFVDLLCISTLLFAVLASVLFLAASRLVEFRLRKAHQLKRSRG